MKDMYTILYVDDEVMNLMLFEANFRKKFKIITSGSAKEGLELLRVNPDVDIVISDMKMPVMNGIEFIKKAKADFPDIRCFILTGFEITDEIQSAIREGLIIKYFSKPFNIKEIEASIFETMNLNLE
jgi:two-component system, response regulator, stage 0 sporulation protein F